MPVDQIILLVTLISMIITCTGIWWGFLQPPQWVLHCASCLSRNFTVKPAGTDTSRVELETDDSSDSDGDRCETELPSIQAKLEKHAARKSPERKSSTGGATKVDSAADLHKSTSLRCIAVSLQGQLAIGYYSIRVWSLVVCTQPYQPLYDHML